MAQPRSRTQTWQQTELWQRLAKMPSAKATCAVLERLLPRIETVLAKAETAPSDFTLHDEDHAARVARWMPQIIPQSTWKKLVPEELGLLLLGAYLHDVGMTPPQKMVRLHHHYLLTGEREELGDAEVERFQAWLDREGGGIVPPMVTDAPTSAELRLGEQLITHYVRHRHNDESKLFIDKELGEVDELYHDARHDLVRLCQSHHFDYHELAAPDFDPRIVAGDRVIHLRYMACVLRIADILEADRARTPEIILRHRDVSSASRPYWKKDHHVDISLRERQVHFYARPYRAQVHRLIEEMADAVEYELKLCRRLAIEHPFELHRQRSLPHIWDLRETVDYDIEPQSGAYEYIDGSFRPDTQRLLELLAGTQLYHTPLAAVRELLQNAVDAVKEQIARERLAKDPSDPQLAELLARTHDISLRLETGGDGRKYLVCRDDGVGMTKAIIRDFLLVSGRADRPELLALERHCERAGFRLARTGQFGIGFLSYFMLADQVIVITRRSQICPDYEPVGWRFETEGVGSFGELRQEPAAPPGTEVRLRLREERSKTVWTLLEQLLRSSFSPSYGIQKSDWEQTWVDYIRSLFSRLPCRLKVHTPTRQVQMEPGWISDQPHSVSLNDEQTWLRGQIDAALRLHQKEGELPGGIGRYRMLLPYYELPEGQSLAFVLDSADTEGGKIQRKHDTMPLIGASSILHSWKGFHLTDSSHREEFPDGWALDEIRPATLEIDWERAPFCAISVDRNELKILDNDRYWSFWSDLSAMIRREVQSFVRSVSGSSYAPLNFRLAGLPIPPEIELNWIRLPKIPDHIYSWGPIDLPAFWMFGLQNEERSQDFCWGETTIPTLPQPCGVYPWDIENTPPNRLLLLPRGSQSALAGVWECRPRERPSTHGFCTTHFPDGWEMLCGVTWREEYRQYRVIVENSVTWMNLANPLVRQCSHEAVVWVREQLHSPGDFAQRFEKLREHLPSRHDYHAAWLLLAFEEGEIDALKKIGQEPSDWARFWECLFEGEPHPPRELRYWRYTDTRFFNDQLTMILFALSPTGVEVYEGADLLYRLMPTPGSEWMLTLFHSADQKC
jgi:hypothetical protein